MIRPKTVVLILTLVGLMAGATFAQVPASTHPAKGDEQFVGDLTWTFQGGEQTRRLDGTWFHLTGYRQKTGIALFGAREAGLTGAGIGPSYQVLLGRFPKGALWGGGAFLINGADAADAATGALNLELVYELYLGKVGALRVGGRYTDALDVQDAALADGFDGVYNLFVGFGVFINRDSVVN